jgi:hypothetical protein
MQLRKTDYHTCSTMPLQQGLLLFTQQYTCVYSTSQYIVHLFHRVPDQTYRKSAKLSQHAESGCRAAILHFSISGGKSFPPPPPHQMRINGPAVITSPNRVNVFFLKRHTYITFGSNLYYPYIQYRYPIAIENCDISNFADFLNENQRSRSRYFS